MSSSDAEGIPDHDPLEGLEARLRTNSHAFESLLALTPARDYYGSHIMDGRDPSEQWNRRKQTTAEKRAARKAKLHPDRQRSALDVLREREGEVAMKRKREEEGDDVDDDGAGGKSGKRQKRASGGDGDGEEATRREKARRRKERRQKKRVKSAEKKAKAEARRARKQERDLAEAQSENAPSRTTGGERDADESNEHPADLEDFDISGLAEPEQDMANEREEDAWAGSSAPTTPLIDSPAFDLATNQSASSSSSSISPPSITDHPPSSPPQIRNPPVSLTSLISTTTNSTTPTQPSTSSQPAEITPGTSSPRLHLPDINREDLSARLNKRMEEMRAARKADGPDGKPIKSRQELMDQRRRKEEQRKANKKAQRLKEKEQEERKREEQLRGSGSPLSKVGDIFSPPPRENNYAFSRLAFFSDGNNADAADQRKKKKGPSDPRTALQAAQNRDAHFSHLPAHKQSKQMEKEMWNHAASRAHGERRTSLKDDTSLLKRALKRKDKQKGKSEREWKEREQGKVMAGEMRVKKREANLQKRREEKKGGGSGSGGKGKKKGGVPGGVKGGKKGKGKGRGRPGFEGRFKA